MELAYALRDGIPVVTMSSEDGENRLDTAGLAELSHILRQLEEEDRRCLVLTAEGENFCLGGNLGHLTAMGYPDIEAFGGVFTDTLLSMTRSGIVVIAAVNGHVQGGGISLLDACDLAVASEEAAFAIPEVSGGLPPVISFAGAYRTLGRKRANECALLATAFSAAEALRLGLVNQVAEKGRVLEISLEMAAKVLQAGSFCIREIKTLSLRMDCGRHAARLGSAADRLSGIMLSRAEKGEPL